MEFHANEDIIELAKSINRTVDSRTKPLDTIIERLKTKLIDAYKKQGTETQLIKQLRTQLRWIPANQPPEDTFKVWVCNTKVGFTGEDRYLPEQKRWESGRTWTYWMKPITLPKGE